MGFLEWAQSVKICMFHIKPPYRYPLQRRFSKSRWIRISTSAPFLANDASSKAPYTKWSWRQVLRPCIDLIKWALIHEGDLATSVTEFSICQQQRPMWKSCWNYLLWGSGRCLAVFWGSGMLSWWKKQLFVLKGEIHILVVDLSIPFLPELPFMNLQNISSIAMVAHTIQLPTRNTYYEKEVQ